MGRTVAHVAASCGCLETCALLARSYKARLNLVDVFGDTPVDNAVSRGEDAIAALLRRVGVLSGADPALAGLREKAHKRQDTVLEVLQRSRTEAILAGLPEERAVESMKLVVQAFKTFSEVRLVGMLEASCLPFLFDYKQLQTTALCKTGCSALGKLLYSQNAQARTKPSTLQTKSHKLQGVFKNMQIMLTTLQQSLANHGGPRASTVIDTKLKAAITALVGQFTEMQGVLETPTHEFAAVDCFLVRSLSHSAIRKSVEEVQHEIKRVCLRTLCLFWSFAAFYVYKCNGFVTSV